MSLALLSTTTPTLAAEPRTRSTAEVEARELSLAGDHVRSAEKWAEVAEAAEDPKTRTIAVFQGYQAWLAAYAEDHDVTRLCRARALLAGVVDLDDVGDAVRREAAARIAELDARVTELDDAGACEDAKSDVWEVLMPVPSARSSGPSPATRPGRFAAPEEIDADAPRRPAATARAFSIAGGVSLGVGVSLLGAMVYGLAVDARSAFALSGYNVKKIAGTLTDDDWEQIEALGVEGKEGARLAKTTGITGGIAVITGAALLIQARRVRTRTLVLYPAVGQGQAGLGLRGHF